MRRRELLLVVTAIMSAPGCLRAQQKSMPVIGFLNTVSPGPTVEPIDMGFRRGLEETGYVEGRNLDRISLDGRSQ
jgi:hypothetical protein